MRFPRNGRRRGGRWLTAVLARWLGVGAVPAWCRRAWAWPRRRVRVVGACLPGALERRARRAPSSGPSGRSMRWMSGGGSSLPPDYSAAPARARDRDRSLRPARPGRTAATVLVLGLLLLGAAAAEAQTVRILVSNSGQTADDSANTSGNRHAQLFRTGANAAGYTLTQVVVNSEDAEGDDFDVEVCEADTTANEFPTTTCTALTAPASFAAGNLHFPHAGLALSANTNYVVVITQRGTGSVELNSTTSGGEDTSLGLSDWSIKDKFYWRSGITWMIKSGSDEALRIIVRGYVGVSLDATDATLNALSVSGTTLSPAFAAATTNYHAVVANSVSQATITETTSEATATVEYLDDSDATQTDADTTTAGLQHNLSVGTNTVKVKVTAPDTTTTEDLHRRRVSHRRSRRVQPRVDGEPDLDGKPDRGNAELVVGPRSVTAPHRGANLDDTNDQFRWHRRTSIEAARVTSFRILDPTSAQPRRRSAHSGPPPTISCWHVGAQSSTRSRTPITYDLTAQTRLCLVHQRPHLGRRQRRLPGADGRGPGSLVRSP